MLESMRHASQNGVVKILLILLAGSFVVWGVGDMLGGGNRVVLAKVGDREVTQQDFEEALGREVGRLRQMFGQSLSEEQVKAMGLEQQVLGRLVDQNLIEQRAEALGIMIGKNAVRKQLYENPLFHNEAGEFDAAGFRAILQANNISEDRFIHNIQKDTAVRILFDGFALPEVDQSAYAKTLLQHRYQQRVVEILTIPANFRQQKNEPSEVELQQYYQEHAAEFEVPEYRDFSYIRFGIDEVINDIKPSDDEVESYYQTHLGEYSQPEKREVTQYLFDDEAAAQAAKEALLAGKSGFSNEKSSLGEVSYNDLPSAEIAEAIFATEQGHYSAPVKTVLGWHVLKVNRIIAPKNKPLAEVKKEIVQRLSEERAGDRLFELSGQVEDELAAGMALAEVAQKHGFELKTAKEIGRDGISKKGERFDAADGEFILSQAYTTASGESSSLSITPDNTHYVVTAVTQIEPSKVKALDEVKGKLLDLWAKEQQKVQLNAIAAEMLAAEDKTVEFLAKAYHLPAPKKQRLGRYRYTKERLYPGSLYQDIFMTEKGKMTRAHEGENGELYIAEVKEIHAPDHATRKEELKQIQQELQVGFQNALIDQYRDFLRQQYKIKFFVANQPE